MCEDKAGRDEAGGAYIEHVSTGASHPNAESAHLGARPIKNKPRMSGVCSAQFSGVNQNSTGVEIQSTLGESAAMAAVGESGPVSTTPWFACRATTEVPKQCDNADPNRRFTDLSR